MNFCFICGLSFKIRKLLLKHIKKEHWGYYDKEKAS